MVNGLQTVEVMEKYDMGKTDTGKDDRTPLMVVDLDGTLVSVNTFTLFTKWLAQHLYHDYGFIPLLGQRIVARKTYVDLQNHSNPVCDRK